MILHQSLRGVNYTVLQHTVHKNEGTQHGFFFSFAHRLFIKISNIHTDVVVEAHFAPRAGAMESFKLAHRNVSSHHVKTSIRLDCSVISNGRRPWQQVANRILQSCMFSFFKLAVVLSI